MTEDNELITLRGASFASIAEAAQERMALERVGTIDPALAEMIEYEVAFLVALAEAGVPAYATEGLIRGNPREGIAPGALRKALAAVITAYRNHQVAL